MASVPNSYDEVPYPSYPSSQTHPDRLATPAQLFGMEPAPVENCRVLELGCNDGGNLIPMAYELANSEFIGIDLAARPIAHGQAIVRELELSNIALRQMDLQDVSASFGKFDYIIAHGLYSWVPPPLREKILQICRENLAPAGVAYVSYNAYPGWHLRAMIREMMLSHVRPFTEPGERIRQARALLNFLGEAQNNPDALWFKRELEKVSEEEDGTLFHDDLAEANTAFYFVQFMDHASRYGLQYLAEADLYEMQDHIYPAAVTEALRSMGQHQVIVKEQYLDFLKCRRFRQTLLCHGEVAIDRSLHPGLLRRFLVASAARPVSSRPDLSPGTVEEFGGKRGAAMATDYPLAKSAMLCLGEIWPRGIQFSRLVEKAHERLGIALDPEKGIGGEEATMLAEILLKTYSGGLVELHTWMLEPVLEVGERPVASPLARLQARNSDTLTTRGHTVIRVEDELTRRLLTLLDGTRNRAELLSELAKSVEAKKLESHKTAMEALSGRLDEMLGEAVNLGFMVG